jgi:hypothetical protein
MGSSEYLWTQQLAAKGRRIGRHSCWVSCWDCHSQAKMHTHEWNVKPWLKVTKGRMAWERESAAESAGTSTCLHQNLEQWAKGRTLLFLRTIPEGFDFCHPSSPLHHQRDTCERQKDESQTPCPHSKPLETKLSLVRDLHIKLGNEWQRVIIRTENDCFSKLKLLKIIELIGKGISKGNR